MIIWLLHRFLELLASDVEFTVISFLLKRVAMTLRREAANLYVVLFSAFESVKNNKELVYISC